MSTDKPLFSVCILDHQASTVARSLSAVMTALSKTHVRGSEVMVVSSSPEISLSLHNVIEEFPDVKVVVLPEGTNRADMVNYCIRKTSGDMFTILNSNMVISDNYFVKLYEYKEKVNWFAVVPSLRMVEGIAAKHETVPMPCKSRFNQSDLSLEYRYGGSKAAPVLYAPLGISTWRREILVQLNGFSSAYQILRYSFHSDAELSYRAWTYGYGVLYDPELSMTAIPVNASRSFYSLWPALLDENDFIYKLFWNLSYGLFILRNKIPYSYATSFLASLVKFDLIAILVRTLSQFLFAFKKERYSGLGKTYTFEMIRAMTDKDSL